MRLTWWETPQWLSYEAAYQPAIPRVQELAEATWQTRVIDLSLSEEELWRGVRKSYHAIIHKAERTRAIYEWTAVGAMDAARKIHLAEAGRQTRPIETWDLMDVWRRDGFGLLVGAEREFDMTPVAFAYFIIWEGWAYYASAAALERDINHALIWHAMKMLKARGVRVLEMGWQGHAQDEKGRGIEMFRRGFGGHDVQASEGPTVTFAACECGCGVSGPYGQIEWIHADDARFERGC